MSYCEANDLAVGYNSPLLEHIKFAAERGQILTLIGRLPRSLRRRVGPFCSMGSPFRYTHRMPARAKWR